MLMQVPRVLVHTDVPSLVAFVDAHFEDLPVLKDWLEETFGMDLLEEHLSLLQTVLVRANKYLVQPSHAVEAQMNLKLKVVSQVRTSVDEHSTRIVNSVMWSSTDSTDREIDVNPPYHKNTSILN